ncbi:MAG: hypothetical protein MI723_13355 [Caulobacterales bacterium]|nr:hypothetical protein [Caulobacterales bacterium]
MTTRVVQWGTGAMGRTCLRAALDHPGLEMVGALVHSPSKHGQDVGALVRREPIGVAATMHLDDILALDADLVIHAARIEPPYARHDEEILRLMASGKNVISINGRAFPRRWGGEHVARIEEAGRAGGGTTLFGTGLNPGFAVERIATAATAICLKVDHVAVTEVVDANPIKSPAYVFDVLGFGSDPGAVDPNDPDWAPAVPLNGMFSEVVALFVARLGRTLEEVRADHAMFAATTDIDVAAGTIAKGTVAHTRWRWHGVADGRIVFTLTVNWVMERAHLADPNHPLWTVEVTGAPGVKMAIDLTKPDGDPAKTSAEQYGVAGAVINAIPAVCAAPAGVLALPGLFTQAATAMR